MLIKPIDIIIFLEINMLNKTNTFFILIIFLSSILFSFKGDVNITCSFNIDCNDCDFCGEESEIYTNCNYDNIFCKEDNQHFFSPRLKNEYDKFFRKDEEIDKLCGNEDIEYILKKEPITFLEINKNNYPKGKYIHCLYTFNNLEKYKKYAPSIIFQINKKDNNKKSDMIFNIIIEHTNRDEEKIQKLITNNNLTENNIFEDSLTDTEELLIFIDILNINYEGEENLILKYQINKNKYLLNLSSHILYASLILIFLIILFVLIMKLCFPECKKSSTTDPNYEQARNLAHPRLSRDENMENIIINRNEMSPEIKKKIKYLSEKVLKNEIYSKNFEKYGSTCTICLENFIDEKSQISITPCEHIFHMECIKKWIQSNGFKPYCPNCKHKFIKDENNSPVMMIVRTNRNNHNNNRRSSTNRRLNNENNISHISA